ncbi:hypothetical protein SPBRAN_1347 [uncultured Candidatus Thioglobus sp.]|nr:hypothetical protein SPBRAN_1347 [uncultured Candidatus Thioglobus sp.]
MNYSAEVLTVKKQCKVRILDKTPNFSESKLNLTLAQGIAKGEKIDFFDAKSGGIGCQ